MTMHSAASFGHDIKHDNDFISGLVPNLVEQAVTNQAESIQTPSYV